MKPPKHCAVPGCGTGPHPERRKVVGNPACCATHKNTPAASLPTVVARTPALPPTAPYRVPGVFNRKQDEKLHAVIAALLSPGMQVLPADGHQAWPLYVASYGEFSRVWLTNTRGGAGTISVKAYELAPADAVVLPSPEEVEAAVARGDVSVYHVPPPRTSGFYRRHNSRGSVRFSEGLRACKGCTPGPHPGVGLPGRRCEPARCDAFGSPDARLSSRQPASVAAA